MPELTTELTINPVQKSAIEFAAGAMQVIAGPGSGKTFVITQRIRYLIDCCKIEPADILVITFTKAAAKEMQQRFRRLMDKKDTSVNFGTFHAVFYHILRQTGKYRNYTLITEIEKRKLLLHILHMPASAMLLNNEKVENVLEQIGRLKNNGEKIDELPAEAFSDDSLDANELKRIYREYNQYLKEFNKLDFDDMGLLCLKLLRENSELLNQWRERYRYIMIDEFQDINSLQYEIIKEIAAPLNNLFVVGDDDQSIYGFRGANPDIMRKFMKDYPEAKQLILDINYRCHEQIVNASLSVIDMNKNRFEKAIRASHNDGKGVLIHSYPDADTENEELIHMLKELAAKNTHKALSNTAVIYRTNHECSLLAEKMLVNKIPFIMREKIQCQYDHFVIKDILAYMEFANGNRSREIFHLFMNRPLRYLKKDSAVNNPVVLEELLKYYRDDDKMQEVSRKLFHHIERVGSLKPYTAINYIRKVIGYDDYIRHNYDKETSEKLLSIADNFQAFSKQYDSFLNMNDYISQCRELVRNKREEVKSAMASSEAAKAESEGICLLTMHASKGLEFDTVYLPDVNEGRIPLKKSVTKEAIEEERRMFYVAMTRAKKELHILYCSQKDGRDTPSRFLEPVLKK
ncbi:MAG: ATP-dependent helicase [Clostridiales bacterium]|nr:ATP-dependent helicase [Clostridiales bacterium]